MAKLESERNKTGMDTEFKKQANNGQGKITREKVSPSWRIVTRALLSAKLALERATHQEGRQDPVMITISSALPG